MAAPHAGWRLCWAASATQALWWAVRSSCPPLMAPRVSGLSAINYLFPRICSSSLLIFLTFQLSWNVYSRLYTLVNSVRRYLNLAFWNHRVLGTIMQVDVCATGHVTLKASTILHRIHMTAWMPASVVSGLACRSGAHRHLLSSQESVLSPPWALCGLVLSLNTPAPAVCEPMVAGLAYPLDMVGTGLGPVIL